MDVTLLETRSHCQQGNYLLAGKIPVRSGMQWNNSEPSAVREQVRSGGVGTAGRHIIPARFCCLFPPRARHDTSSSNLKDDLPPP